MSRKYTYDGVEIPESAFSRSNGFYSLKSKRQIKGSSQTGHKGVDIGQLTGTGTGPFIFGSLTVELPAFYKENGIQPPGPEGSPPARSPPFQGFGFIPPAQPDSQLLKPKYEPFPGTIPQGPVLTKPGAGFPAPLGFPATGTGSGKFTSFGPSGPVPPVAMPAVPVVNQAPVLRVGAAFPGTFPGGKAQQAAPAWPVAAAPPVPAWPIAAAPPAPTWAAVPQVGHAGIPGGPATKIRLPGYGMMSGAPVAPAVIAALPVPAQVCLLGSVSAYIPEDGVTDVEAIPDRTIASMCDFHFQGLKGKGKVVSVTDGDTIKMLVYISLSDLSQGKEVKGRKKEPELKAAAVTSSSSGTSGFFTVLKIRLLGVDTAEKNTPQGKLAKQMMIDKYRSLKNIVYYRLHGPDKYGRTLADLYEDNQYSRKLNDFLIGKKFGGLGAIALAYDGGKKDDYMKMLPTGQQQTDDEDDDDATLVLDV